MSSFEHSIVEPRWIRLNRELHERYIMVIMIEGEASPERDRKLESQINGEKVECYLVECWLD